jgi:hypothetical protein
MITFKKHCLFLCVNKNIIYTIIFVLYLVIFQKTSYLLTQALSLNKMRILFQNVLIMFFRILIVITDVIFL